MIHHCYSAEVSGWKQVKEINAAAQSTLKWLNQQVALIRQGIAAMKGASASDAAIILAEKERDLAVHTVKKASHVARKCIDKLLATLDAHKAHLSSEMQLQQEELKGLQRDEQAASANLNIKVSDHSLTVLSLPIPALVCACFFPSCGW
jgi:beta-galactosidase/beta-glucuronidase